jgi:hypothetical protein
VRRVGLRLRWRRCARTPGAGSCGASSSGAAGSLLAAGPVLVGHPLWLDRGIGLRRSSGCRWTGERRDSCGGWVKVGACFGLLGFSFAIGVTRPLPIASAVGGHTSVRATAAKPRSRSCARPARSGCSAKTKPHGRTERERDREQLTPSAQRCSHCGSSSATRTSGHRHFAAPTTQARSSGSPRTSAATGHASPPAPSRSGYLYITVDEPPPTTTG